ncbi:MAG TPA: gamma carbonic anhydrase family protein, partial [Rhodoferax sp.]|nr:gamma carbonic anhydrase family protein [Rhodoferax sp.]
VRQLSPEQIQGLRRSADHYVANAQRFKTTLNKLA